jgi:hypothetical protein
VIERLVAQSLDVGQFADIAPAPEDGESFLPQPIDCGRDIGVRPGREHHGGALLTEEPGHGEPEPARGAGDDCPSSA